MATTYTGRLLMPTNFGVPSPLDIAVQLGRLPRFAGATRVWPWSVLHHTVACLKYAYEFGAMSQFELALLALHDAEECATGDVPTTWKGTETRTWQDRLSGRLFRRYLRWEEKGNSPQYVADSLEQVKKVDTLLLVAEMYEVGPPLVLSHSGFDCHGLYNSNLEAARGVVRQVAYDFSRPGDSQYEYGSLVLWYLMQLRVLSAVPAMFESEVAGTLKSYDPDADRTEVVEIVHAPGVPDLKLTTRKVGDYDDFDEAGDDGDDLPF